MGCLFWFNFFIFVTCEFSCCFGVDVARSGSGVAATAEDTAVVQGVGVYWVGEGIYWSDVVDGVGFVAADCTVVVVLEQLFAYGLECRVASCFGVVCGHGCFLCVIASALGLRPVVAFGCVFESGVCVPHSSEQVTLGCRTR